MRPQLAPRLLVPLDGSCDADEALTFAETIAESIAAEIHVLFVTDEPLAGEAVAERLGIGAQWTSRVHLHCESGEVANTICGVARDLAASAIFMPTHGTSGDLTVPAGHVTLGVLEHPPCPVYVIRSALDFRAQAHRIRHLRRILVPLDGTTEAAQAMERAAMLAARGNSRLLLLYVIDPGRGARQRTIPVYYDQSYLELEAWKEEFVRNGFARTRRPASVKPEAALRLGDPGEQIVGYAREEDCDLIVTAWGGRISRGRARVVTTLLEQAVCPLLFLRAQRRDNGH